jgi:hypothetical protein
MVFTFVTDKVFKYNLSGTLLGSWTVAGAGGSPTGITLDPAGGGALWIVDSGTDRVYQFDNARGLTSGSLYPSTSFALAAGNTNPQCIADPPAPNQGASRAIAPVRTLRLMTNPAAHHGLTIPGHMMRSGRRLRFPGNRANLSWLDPGPNPDYD